MNVAGRKRIHITITFSILVLGSVIGWLWPFSFTSLDWVRILLISAPLLWVPIAVIASDELVPTPDRLLRLFFPAALLFAFAFLLPPMRIAGLCLLPWLLLALCLAFGAVVELLNKKQYTMPHLCATTSYLFLVVGVIWAVADRLDIQFFGFDPVIGLLTAVHFHFAGFLLLLIAGLALRNWDSPLALLVGWMVILGPPMVAIGIFTTHYGGPQVVELMAATVMALGGMGIALRHLQLGLQHKGRRLYWLLGGALLAVGMLLALLYGWRPVFSISLLSIPWMYAVHGSVNASALALLVVGWLNKP